MVSPVIVVFAFRFGYLQRFHRRGVAVATIIRGSIGTGITGPSSILMIFFASRSTTATGFQSVRPVVAVAGIQITDHLQQTRILLQAIFAIKSQR